MKLPDLKIQDTSYISMINHPDIKIELKECKIVPIDIPYFKEKYKKLKIK